MIDAHPFPSRWINSPAHGLFATLIGTTIEFFDVYIYATAVMLVFPAPAGGEQCLPTAGPR